MTLVLAGDIGGTHTRLAILERRGSRWHPTAAATAQNRGFASLDAVLDDFLARQSFAGELACFGVAGPVEGRRCQVTNLPWTVDAEALEARRGWRIGLLNDLEALAHGIGELGEGDLACLQTGTVRRGNAALIAAGTGLGQAGLFFDGVRHRPFATEGGHADFAPRDEREIALLRHLQGELGGRVSVERVVSGPGLEAILRFLNARDGEAGEALRAAEISRRALEGACARCVEALEIFVELYAAEAGNLALKVMARGGVYLGGGIAPKILPALRDPRFRRHFAAKGRMSPLLESMPVHVILEPDAALLGAAAYVSSEMPAAVAMAGRS